MEKPTFHNMNNISRLHMLSFVIIVGWLRGATSFVEGSRYGGKEAKPTLPSNPSAPHDLDGDGDRGTPWVWTGAQVNRDELPNPFGDDQPACDFPIYTLSEWHAEHGGDLPDHAAVFEYDKSVPFPGLEHFANFSAVLEHFGEDVVDTQPGYAQAGGHLGNLWPESKVGWKGPLKDLSKVWDTSRRGWYHSEFNCHSSICKKFVPEMGPVVPFGNGLNAHRINFLVGGPGSGLPFHRHSETWQTVVTGRKAWFVVPPGFMYEALSEVVGPFLYPPDAWDLRTRSAPDTNQAFHFSPNRGDPPTLCPRACDPPLPPSISLFLSLSFAAAEQEQGAWAAPTAVRPVPRRVSVAAQDVVARNFKPGPVGGLR